MRKVRFAWPVASIIIALASACGAPVRKADVPEAPLIGSTVDIDQGRLQGAVDDGVVEFKGVPFAAPPIAELRWRAPQPPTKWGDTRVANAFSATCMQAEDCLYLNIYAPENVKQRDRLPVMVWIHGGGFVYGAGSVYDGSQFARRGVIVVTINYRLGRAGWFAHPALTAENPKGPLGNYGLMDQVAALQWVKDNIGGFGGDKKNVTIFGESAGAISINYLMLAPEAKGLFEKAIAESGFGRLAATPMAVSEQAGMRFAERADVHGTDAGAAKALRALPFAKLSANVPPIGAPGQILPMADGRLITWSAADGFARGLEARVPYLLGGNSDEASLTRRGLNAADRLAAIQVNRDAFLAAYDPENTLDADRVIARYFTDRSISEPDRNLARIHANHGSPTYVYHFSYTPAAQRARSFGLAHGGEIPYVFNMPRAAGFDEEGKAVALAANSYWTEFAKTGDPGSAGGPYWPKFLSDDEYMMEFPASGVPIVVKHFHKARLDWVQANLPR